MSNKQVIILSGVSGSGKSTWIRKHYPRTWSPVLVSAGYGGSEIGGDATVFSADHFFMKHPDHDRDLHDMRSKVLSDLEYKFDPTKLKEAHATCFREFILQCMIRNHVGGTLIVDNTNTTVEEIAPYVQGADAFGFEHKIVSIDCSWYELKDVAARNRHGVPLVCIEAQWRQLSERLFPKHWNHEWMEIDL